MSDKQKPPATVYEDDDGPMPAGNAAMPPRPAPIQPMGSPGGMIQPMGRGGFGGAMAGGGAVSEVDGSASDANATIAVFMAGAAGFVGAAGPTLADSAAAGLAWLLLLHGGTMRLVLLPRGMAGVFKLYNVGQDTRFCPGGDKETSYMYELGFPRDYYGPSAPWAEEVKAEAAELFHLVGALVSGEWAGALARRAGGGGA